MKRNTVAAAFLIFSLLFLSIEAKCNHDFVHAKRLQEEPGYAEALHKFNLEFERDYHSILDAHPHIKRRDVPCATLFYIPVVFHILYWDAKDNVSVSRIDAEMKALNDYFSGQTPGRQNVSSTFQGTMAGDTCIRLVYANKNKQSQSFPGGKAIVYYQTALARITGDQAQSCGAIGTTDVSSTVLWSANNTLTDPWNNVYGPGADVLNQTKVLNIVACPKLSGTTLGYATLPTSTVGVYDGVTIINGEIGAENSCSSKTGSVNAHEIGHYLNLYHTFNGGSCSGNGDYVDDTPPNDKEMYNWAQPAGCPNVPDCNGVSPPESGFARCSGTADSYNIMEYNTNPCMIRFSTGQLARMTKVMTDPNSVRRNLRFSEYLTVPNVCIPQCFQKNCGSDGCGGSCGTCPQQLTCTSGVCNATEPANSKCLNATVITPTAFPGNTYAVHNLGISADIVDGKWTPNCAPSPYLAYVATRVVWFTFTGTGKFTNITTCSSTYDENADTKLYLFEANDCSFLSGSLPPPQCRGYNNDVTSNICSGNLKLSFLQFCSNSTKYYLAVGLDPQGPFNLQISDGAPCSAKKREIEYELEQVQPVESHEIVRRAGVVPVVPDTCANAINLDTNGCGPLSGQTGGQALSSGTCVINADTSYAAEASYSLCFKDKVQGLFYKFVGQGKLVTITTCASTFSASPIDTEIQVVTFSNGLTNCLASACIAFNDNDVNCASNSLASTLKICAQSQVTYYIFVDGANDESGTVQITINVGANCTASAQRNCSNAVAIAPPAQVNTTTVISGSIVDANSIAVLDCDVPTSGFAEEFDISNGLYYTLTTNDTATYSISTCSNNTNFDTQIRVFTGNCSNLVCLDQNDDADSPSCGVNADASTITAFCGGVNKTYYILVEGYDSSLGSFNLIVNKTNAACTVCQPNCPTGAACGNDGCGGICGTNGGCDVTTVCQNYQCVCVPDCAGRTCGDNGCGGQCGTSCTGSQSCIAGVCTTLVNNDNCTNAVTITPNVPQYSTLNGRTADTIPAACEINSTSSNPGVWYKFTGDGRTWKLSTCNTNTQDLDTIIFVMTGSCGALACIASNDDASSCSFNRFASELSFLTVAGNNYFVLVRSFDSQVFGSPEFSLVATATGPFSCFPACGTGQTCLTSSGTCCTPNCLGKTCGSNGCGGSCGSCLTGICLNAGTCCVPQCSGRVCGPDGCGSDCGTCSGNTNTCTAAGTCTCVPNCQGKNCGDNGCGGSCGTCKDGFACNSGVCQCVPNCQGKSCGSNGCGGSCGACSNGQLCTLGGSCCTRSCDPAWQCGDDGCGGNCGDCGPNHYCNFHTCVCLPQCSVNQKCGSDGCGGQCGTCPSSEDCCDGGCHDFSNTVNSFYSCTSDGHSNGHCLNELDDCEKAIVAAQFLSTPAFLKKRDSLSDSVASVLGLPSNAVITMEYTGDPVRKVDIAILSVPGKPAQVSAENLVFLINSGQFQPAIIKGFYAEITHTSFSGDVPSSSSPSSSSSPTGPASNNPSPSSSSSQSFSPSSGPTTASSIPVPSSSKAAYLTYPFPFFVIALLFSYLLLN